jgi:site-specific recombinase XerD
MAEDLKLRRYKPSTCDTYLRCARAFVAYHRRPPHEMGADEVRAFLLYLASERKVAPATHHQYVAAIKFLYATTLGRPEVAVAIPWPKVPHKLPRILSGTEVEALLDTMGSVKYRAIVLTAYAAGLRIDEVCSLAVEDIDSKRNLIHVRDGKHGRAAGCTRCSGSRSRPSRTR